MTKRGTVEPMRLALSQLIRYPVTRDLPSTTFVVSWPAELRSLFAWDMQERCSGMRDCWCSTATPRIQTHKTDGYCVEASQSPTGLCRWLWAAQQWSLRSPVGLWCAVVVVERPCSPPGVPYGRPGASDSPEEGKTSDSGSRYLQASRV